MRSARFRGATTLLATVALVAASEAVTFSARQPALPEPENASDVLAKYADALASVAAPRFVSFEYSVEQAGPRNLVQTHRIYRSGLTERDEILSVDGQALPHPSIRIIRNRVDRYSIAALAPRPREYTFAFSSAHRVGSHFDYIFHTETRSGGAFAVRTVAIDGLRYLPSQITFVTVAGAVRGRGRLSFAKYDRYWMIAEATVSSRVNGTVARERIAWSRYVFPTSLPHSTFTAPRPLPSATP